MVRKVQRRGLLLLVAALIITLDGGYKPEDSVLITPVSEVDSRQTSISPVLEAHLGRKFINKNISHMCHRQESLRQENILLDQGLLGHPCYLPVSILDRKEDLPFVQVDL